MKRFLLVVFLFLLSLSLFSLDIETSKTLFLQYIENYENPLNDDFLSAIKSLIDKELPLYRFYKIWLVGSVEKTEVTKKVGDYLNVIYEKYQGGSDEEKLARAAFMAYLEAKLERKNFESSFIKASPNFNQFFNSYQNKVVLIARNYFTDLLAKHLGADIDLPVDIDAPYYDFDFNYTPRYKVSGYEFEMQYLANDPEFVKTFNQYLKTLSENPSTIEKQILRYGGLLQRSIIKVIAGLKNIYSEIFAKIAPRDFNLWSLRWIFYIILIVLSLIIFKQKKWNFVIILISLVEILYLFLGFDYLSSSSSTIYGLVSLFGFISAGLIFLKQRNITALLMSFIVLLSFFIPTYYSPDLVMKNNLDFEDSIYFSELTNDVLKDNYSKFSNVVKGLLTQSNSSIIETEDIVRRLKTNALNFEKKIQDSKYLNVDNFDKRIEDFKNVALEFENYQIEENIRKRKYYSYEKEILDFAQKIAKISSEKFENLFLTEITKKLNYEEVKPTLNKIKIKLENIKDLENVPVKFYRTKYGLLTFVLVSIALFLTAVKFKYDFIWYIAALISSIFMLINPVEFIVQFGVPTIHITYKFVIPLILIPGIVMIIKKLIPYKG